MTTKLAILSGLCALAMFTTACSSTKSAMNNSNNGATTAKTGENLPAVAEAPQGLPPRQSWGNNISPYVN